MRIESSQNRIIKEINSLKQKKYREQKGLFIVEGERLLSEASPEYVLVSDDYAGDTGIFDTIYTTTPEIFAKAADTVTPQGILGVCKMPEHNIDNIPDEPFLVILERVCDPGNLGTIIRTADAAGADGVVLSKGCADVYSPKTVRSTMGSLFHLPIYKDIDIAKFIKENKIKMLAAHLKGTKSCFTADMTGGIGILIGNEANGLSDEVSTLADELVKIPMPGKAESMNASVAAAIMIYEAVRQRTK